MNPSLLPVKSGAHGSARHITSIDWRSKGLSDVDEEVAAILLQLPWLIFDSNTFTWGGKKKRRFRTRRRYGVINRDPATATATEEPSTSKQFDAVSSPDTPLISSFSAAATNSKRKPLKKKREKEYLLVTQLEKERDLLRSKIEHLRQQKDRAMTINTLLKKRQQELIRNDHQEDVKLREVNTGLTLGMQWQWQWQWTQPLIGNPTVVVGDNSRSYLSLRVGPEKLIDLNLPADGCHVSGPSDSHVDKKVMATLARQKRCRIYKATRRSNLVKGIRL